MYPVSSCPFSREHHPYIHRYQQQWQQKTSSWYFFDTSLNPPHHATNSWINFSPDRHPKKSSIIKNQLLSPSSLITHDFLDMGVSKNRGTPKWMVKIMENPIKMDDLGVENPLFSVQHPYLSTFSTFIFAKIRKNNTDSMSLPTPTAPPDNSGSPEDLSGLRSNPA